MSRILTFILAAVTTLATLILLVSFVGAPTLVLVFKYLAADQTAAVKASLPMCGLLIWSKLIQSVASGIEQAFQRYGIINVLNTAQALLANFGVVVISWMGGRALEMMQWSVLISYVVLAGHVGVSYWLLRQYNLSPKLDKKVASEVAKYSGLSWLGAIGSVIFSHCDRLIVGQLLGVVQLGMYAAITNIVAQINMLSAATVQPILPRLGRGEPSDWKPQVKKNTEINALISLGLGAGLFIAAPFVCTALAVNEVGGRFSAAFQLGAVAYALYSLNAVGYYLLLGLGRLYVFILIQGLSSIASLIFIAYGAVTYGLIGAVMGNFAYLISVGFVVFGMNSIRIKSSQWLMWMRFPLLWFVIVILLENVLPDGSLVRVFALTVQSLVLIGWFAARRLLGQGCEVLK
jgi:O-antigen/teichoic acid export membrane protein